jgi:DNA-binding MarR family transcriptional regulator
MGNMMFSRMTSPVHLTAQAERLMRRRTAEALAPLGLSPAAFMVLVDLAGGQSRTQKELAERLGVEQPTMANTLKRMARDGLIERKARAGDGRITDIRATPKAEGVYASATRAVQAVGDLATRGLTTEERLRFVGTLARIIDNLDAD